MITFLPLIYSQPVNMVTNDKYYDNHSVLFDLEIKSELCCHTWFCNNAATPSLIAIITKVKNIQDHIQHITDVVLSLYCHILCERQLSVAKEGFTEASLGLLANQRRRQLLTGLLKSLRTIKTLVKFTHNILCFCPRLDQHIVESIPHAAGVPLTASLQPWDHSVAG